ncbi:hypothetical protein Leryth_016658, partial [Lithospermum erythrorhizon]
MRNKQKVKNPFFLQSLLISSLDNGVAPPFLLFPDNPSLFANSLELLHFLPFS